MIEKLTGLVRAAVRVVRRPQWTVTLLVLGLAALGSVPAGQAAALLGCFLALLLLGLAFRTLEIDPYDPWSLFRMLGKSLSAKQLAWAVLWLVLAGIAIRTFAYGPRLATWIAVRTGGDKDLAAACLFSLLASICSALFWLITRRNLHTVQRLAADEPAGSDAAELAVGLKRSLAFWTEATICLSLAFIALVPAALLANWAWNVLASAALPLLVISVRVAAHGHR